MYATQTPADSTAVMGKRFGAFFIDLVIGVAIFAVAFFALSESLDTDGSLSCQQVRDAGGTNLCFDSGDSIRYAEGGDATLIYVIAVGFSFVNAVLLQASSGSIGKRLVGLAVVRQDTGAPIGFGKAILRWIVSIVDFVCCFLVGLITALTIKGHKRVADLAAGSVVVAKSSMGTPPTFPGSPNASAGQWTPPAPPAPGNAWGTPAGAPPAPWNAPTMPPASPGGWAPPAAPEPPAPAPWAPPAAPEPPAPAPWAPPAAPEPPAPAPAPQPPAAAPGPQWDPARNAYIQWEPTTGQWLQFDDAAQEWRPIS